MVEWEGLVVVEECMATVSTVCTGEEDMGGFMGPLGCMEGECIMVALVVVQWVVMAWVVVLMELKIPIIHMVLLHRPQDFGFLSYVW